MNRKRILSLAVALAMCLTLSLVTVFAADDPALKCEYDAATATLTITGTGFSEGLHFTTVSGGSSGLMAVAPVPKAVAGKFVAVVKYAAADGVELTITVQEGAGTKVFKYEVENSVCQHDNLSGWQKVDGTGHWEYCLDCEVITTVKTAHTSDNAHATDCTKPNKCTVCAYVITPAGSHTSDNKHATDCAQPSKCTACAYVITPAGSHTFALNLWQATTPPTCVNNGVETQKCDVCGKLGSVTRSIPATGHSFGATPDCGQKCANCTELYECDDPDCPVCTLPKGGYTIKYYKDSLSDGFIDEADGVGTFRQGHRLTPSDITKPNWLNAEKPDGNYGVALVSYPTITCDSARDVVKVLYMPIKRR